MQQQHVIDWLRHRGYRVTVLSDWSLMCANEAAYAQSDPERLADAIRKRRAAKMAEMNIGNRGAGNAGMR